mgnify:CR=1 FL=1
MLGGLIYSVSRTAALSDEIEFLTADFARFEPNPILIGDVDRATGATWISGSTCFDSTVSEAFTESREVWTFAGGETPPGFQSRYEAPDQTNLYGGMGIPLTGVDNTSVENCFRFAGFVQPFPPLLATHMRRNPGVELTMAFQIEIEATDMSNPDEPRRSPLTILRSERFTIPAAGE